MVNYTRWGEQSILAERDSVLPICCRGDGCAGHDSLSLSLSSCSFSMSPALFVSATPPSPPPTSALSGWAVWLILIMFVTFITFDSINGLFFVLLSLCFFFFFSSFCRRWKPLSLSSFCSCCLQIWFFSLPPPPSLLPLSTSLMVRA